MALANNRIAVTDLDGYLYFKNNDFLEFEEYLERLKRRSPMQPRQRFGIDFHTALEHYAVTGVTENLEDLCDWKVEVKLPRPMLTEIFVNGVVNVGPRRSVYVVGKIDAVYGLTVVDYKTVARVNLEQYAEAMQWRTYLALMPEMEHFRYEVFQVSGNRGRGRWTVTDHRSLALERYPKLEEHVTEAVREYDEFLQYLAADGHIELSERGVKREAFRVA